PPYAIWFGKPKEEKKADKSTLPSVLGDAENTYNEKKKDVTDFAGVEEKKPAPGEDPVNAIFAILGSGPSATKGEEEKDKEKEKSEDKPKSKEEASKTKPMPTPADDVC